MLPTLIKAGPLFCWLHSYETFDGNPMWRYAGIETPPVRKTLYKLRPCILRKAETTVTLQEGRTVFEFTDRADLDNLLTDLLAKRFFSRSRNPEAKAAAAVAAKQMLEVRATGQFLVR